MNGLTLDTYSLLNQTEKPLPFNFALEYRVCPYLDGMCGINHGDTMFEDEDEDDEDGFLPGYDM
ncbi:hypothetical protein OUZ56_008311 [Daphnia magna]|uniref:Uncharacterized protein n=1 Tax=Daphnia magna TaxID=35525 RepID=A0ABR0ACL3_9CRUS|nr:hypothetical protein OUZ56_008311 [Daphnia magna]